MRRHERIRIVGIKSQRLEKQRLTSKYVWLCGSAVRFIWLLFLFSIFPPAHPVASPAHPEATSPARGEEKDLSRGDILNIIRAHLAGMGIAAAPDLSPESLHIQVAVPVSMAASDVQVKRMVLDGVRRETRFQLWFPRQPRRPPFTVTTRWAAPGSGTVATNEVPSEWRAAQSGESRLRSATRHAPPRPSVRLGRPATLVIVRPDTRITMGVMPLETGFEGQRIRVRNPANAQVMTAEVVGEGMLRSGTQEGGR